MKEFAVELQRDNDCAVVAVHGEVDTATAPAVQKAVTAAVKDGVDFVVVDLNMVAFLDSSGLGVLVGARRLLNESGGELHVVCAVPRLLQLFRLTNLDDILTVHATVASATAAIAASRHTGDARDP